MMCKCCHVLPHVVIKLPQVEMAHAVRLHTIDSHGVGVVDIAEVQRLCAINGLPDALLRDLRATELAETSFPKLPRASQLLLSENNYTIQSLQSHGQTSCHNSMGASAPCAKSAC